MNAMLVPKDMSVMYRLNKALLKWLKDSGSDDTLLLQNCPSLLGFEFNEQCLLGLKYRVKPVVDMSDRGKIIIDFPGFTPAIDITAPANTKQVRLMIRPIRQPVKDQHYTIANLQPVDQTIVELDYNNTRRKAQRLEIPFKTGAGDLVLLVMGLQYFQQRSFRQLMPVTDPKWMPAGVVGVSYIS
jgi:hypothetical protein